MILVTLGTQDKDFSRLLKAIEKEIKKGNIKEKVVVQAGYTKYSSKNMEIFDLIEKDKLKKLVQECRLLITHGGVGSILEGIQNNKKIIAASRLKKYKEHTNDHQKQIVKKFAEEGYLLELRDFKKLDKLLEKSRNFRPKKFKSNTKNFIDRIETYIKQDQHTSWLNQFRYLFRNGYPGILFSIFNFFLFCLFFGKINLYFNIFLSYLLTSLFSLLGNLIMDISIKGNGKHFCLIKGLILILDLDLMYIMDHIIRCQLIYSKAITNLLILVFSYIIIQFCLKKKE